MLTISSHRCSVLITVLVCLAVIFANTTHLSATVTPPILPPGSQYQLVFASSPYFAVDTDITAYNTFVSQEASLSSTLPTGITWRAIVSTTSIDAITNAPITAPVYDTALS